MDDFVLNVRQIGQYPLLEPQPGDVLLFQEGGQGGPYKSTTAISLVQGAVSGAAQVSFGGPVGAAEFLVPGGGAITGINGLDFGFLQNDRPLPLMTLTVNGDLQLPYGNLSIGRDPATLAEATSRGWVQDNTVWSFMGRRGIVRLTAGDVNQALGVQEGDFLVTRNFVDAQICQSLQQFYSYSPLVFSFNGRTGDIQLNLDDINSANFSEPGSYPQAPSPALGDSSNNIATTAFVDETIQDAVDTVNNSWSAADLAILEILQTQYAPLNSPSFTGQPTAPMPPAGSNDATIPTTAWVMTKITGAVTGVTEWNGRTGQVVFEAADLTGVGGALLASPNFSGSPTAPNPPAADSSQRLATTSWVLGEIGAVSAGVTTFNGRAGAVTLQGTDITGAGGAPINSPVFTGTPTAPNPAPTDSSQQLATTAWVSTNAVKSWNGRAGAVTLQLNDITAAGGAPLASPTFTGVPAAPTAAPGTNTTQLATTAYVVAALGAGGTVTSVNGRSGAVVLNSSDITAAGGAVVDNVIPQCGRLMISGASPSATLQYVPYNGANIKINGVIYPFSTMQAVYNNATINGVAGQTLQASTVYYVYAYYNGTAPALDFSTTGHTSSTQIGNYGVEIKSGDNTRSLIGIVRMTAAAAFADSSDNRLVRSWFNRRSAAMMNVTMANHTMSSLGVWIAVQNLFFSWVQFADEGVSINWSGQMVMQAASTAYTMLYIDGAAVGTSQQGYQNVANAGICAPIGQHLDLAEGYHTAQPYGMTVSNIVVFSGFVYGRLIAS